MISHLTIVSLSKLMRYLAIGLICLLTAFLFISDGTGSRAQGERPLRDKEIPVQFVDEEGNPIKIASARSLLDLDPFGAPLSAALYVEYKNAGNQALAAVKFRLRYLNGQGKDRGTYHAPHAAALLPGASTAAKWKHDKVYPDVEKVLLRTLMVRFADGSEWHSQRIKGLVIPPHSD